VASEGVSYAETKNKANFNPIQELRKSIKSSNKIKFYGKNTATELRNNYTPDQQKLQESDYVFSPYHNKITYIGECANIEDLPSESEGLNKKLAPEIAVIGSTNAGKSTFLKQLLRFNQRERNVPISSDKLAETKRLRYWQLGKDLSIVDTPGFGLNQPDCVNTTLIPYLANRKNLKHIILLIAVSQEDKSLELLRKIMSEY
jgi:ribosome biogenesis GTPase A